eukprot:Gb_16911 [translate_table: standard]
MENNKVTDTHLSSAAAFVEGGVQEACDDACSICLEPFSDNDPATPLRPVIDPEICPAPTGLLVVSMNTICNAYLSGEFLDKPPFRVSEKQRVSHVLATSQFEGSRKVKGTLFEILIIELSLAVKNCLQRWSKKGALDQAGLQIPQCFLGILSKKLSSTMSVPAYADDSDFEERIMQHLAAAAMGRAHNFSRRENLRNRSSGQGHPQFLVFSTHSTPPHVSPISGPNNTEVPGGNNPAVTAVGPIAPVMTAAREEEHGPLPSPPGQTSSRPNRYTGISTRPLENRSESFLPRNNAGQRSPENQQRQRSSDFQSFSESLKSRFTAVSSRYKESISKSTRGFREKLWARNSAVTELGREVQREVSAGIAGVARMMERLDASGKNNGITTSVSGDMEGSSAVTPVRPDVEVSEGPMCPNSSSGSSSCGASSGLSTVPMQPVIDESDSCIDVASVKVKFGVDIEQRSHTCEAAHSCNKFLSFLRKKKNHGTQFGESTTLGIKKPRCLGEGTTPDCV